MAQLAIKGHATRGTEVIEILEMLGGNNKEWIGDDVFSVYFINEDKNIIHSSVNYSIMKVFTLEEFLEKFPYKVGDKVSSKYLNNCKISKMEWESINNKVIYKLQGMGWYAVNELQPYKEETMEEEEENFAECIGKTMQECLFGKQETMEDVIKINIPKGYEFTGVDGDNLKVVFTKIQLQYPKTYKESCDVLGINTMDNDAKGYKHFLLIQFQELIIARDSYWKIAGEQMGLGKPWNQDYDDRCFIIANNNGNIHTYEYHGSNNVILAFPTKEMRDAFYENFKDLIEQCKELL